MTIALPPHSSLALPSKLLCKQRLPSDPDYEFKWIDSASTDVAATFARVLAEQEAAKRAQPVNVKQMRAKR